MMYLESRNSQQAAATRCIPIHTPNASSQPPSLTSAEMLLTNAEAPRLPAMFISPKIVARLDELRWGGHRVAMAGDGINDAPALRASDLSIAMGSGTAVARSQAQVEVVGDDLRTLPLLFEAAAELRRVVRGNVAWTLAYNGVALAFAVAGRLHPVVAAAAMVVSSLVVSVRSHRLLGFGMTGR